MTDRLFGLETEYAMVPAGPSRIAVDRDRLVARLADRAAQLLPSLPDGSGRGLFFCNGARFYIDCGHHPEMTTPEVANPWDAVRYVLAGERILDDLFDGASAEADRLPPVLLFKGNVDYDSRTTWGCHESIMHRADPALLPAQLIPHLVTRIVFTGAGGLDPQSPGVEFMLSPRAVYIEQEVSGESTSSRGIFHSKNETLCKEGYHRLHILCGESLCSETAMWLKTATTVLVVALIEGGAEPGSGVELSAPLDALRIVAGDATCRAALRLARGATATALEIQRHYLEVAEAHCSAHFMPPWTETACVRWRAMLDRLEDAPASVSTTLDWAIKRVLFEQYAAKRGFTWQALGEWTHILHLARSLLNESGSQRGRPTPLEALREPTELGQQIKEQFAPYLLARGLAWDRLEAFARLRKELFEADVRFGQLGDRGIFAGLDRDGVLAHRVPGVDNIEHAVEHPPAIGRARVRSQVIRRLAPDRQSCVCNWSLIVNGRERTRLDLSDPFETSERWTAAPEGAPSFDAWLNGHNWVSRSQALVRTRTEAYHCYLGGYYDRAEQLLRVLVQEEFQLADTYGHLVRVLITTDRLDEAREILAAAWDRRAGAPPDVVARMLWFEVYFCLIDRVDISLPLSRLRGLLEGHGPFNTWTLAPLLEHIRPSLVAEAFELLSALFETWSDRSRLPELDRFEEWRDSVPLLVQ